jgi:hypothetical protein
MNLALDRIQFRQYRGDMKTLTVDACLRDMRNLLANPALWNKSGEGPGWCPITAAGLLIYHPGFPQQRMGLFASLLLQAKVLWRLRRSVPASHRSWSPECVVRYNADPAVSHADLLRWLDTAIGESQAQRSDLLHCHG